MPDAQVNTNLKSQGQKEKIKGPKLPWWVELLFVQIGLPDKWLPTILKKKKECKISFDENKRYISFIFIFILFSIYIFPIVRMANYNNKCVNDYSKTLLSGSKNKSAIKLATIICNGGNVQD